MHCPVCGHEDTRVIDSRLVPGGQGIRRRRECPTCNERFTTLETAQWAYPRVVKRDGRREPFDEHKVRTGLVRALEKRPVPTEALEPIVTELLHWIRSLGDVEVSSRRIGEWLMDQLKILDQVAYVRFASVYRDFQDVQDFRRAIEHLSGTGPDVETKIPENDPSQSA
ncbi:MAG: transcriptional regulator NrdR [Gammaproteobacteria bacterium]